MHSELMRAKALALPFLIATVGVGCDSRIPLRLLEVPSPPQAVVASAGVASVTVSWNANGAPEEVGSYGLAGATVPWSAWEATLPGAFINSNLNCCSFKKSGLSNDSTYYVAVSARNRIGAGGYSNVVSAAPPGWRGTIQTGTSAQDDGLGIAIDAEHNIYLTGSTTGVVAGTAGAGGEDLFLLKFDASGSPVWARQMGTFAQDAGIGIGVDQLQNIYVAGRSGGDLDGDIGFGGEDVFVVKYLPDGTKSWSTLLGTAGADSPWASVTDASGNTFVVGATQGAFGGPNAGGNDVFLLKVDSTGGVGWVRQFGSAANETGYAVATDSAGNVYVTGVTMGGIDGNTNAGGGDVFVGKYDGAGSKLWIRQHGSSFDDTGHGIGLGTASIFIAVDVLGDVLFQTLDQTGTVTDSIAFGQPFTNNDHVQSMVVVGSTAFITWNSQESDSSGDQDGFLTRFDAGVFAWRAQVGAAGKSDALDRAAISPTGRVFAIGDTNAALYGNEYLGVRDIVVVKLDPEGNRQ